LLRNRVTFLLLRILSEKAASWAVSGLPSWKVMPGRIRNR